MSTANREKGIGDAAATVAAVVPVGFEELAKSPFQKGTEVRFDMGGPQMESGTLVELRRGDELHPEGYAVIEISEGLGATEIPLSVLQPAELPPTRVSPTLGLAGVQTENTGKEDHAADTREQIMDDKQARPNIPLRAKIPEHGGHVQKDEGRQAGNGGGRGTLRMVRYAIGILVTIALGYWAYSSWQVHVETEQKRTAGDARRESLKASVMEMASKVNAVTDWEASLAGGKKTKWAPVFTAELQKHWVIDRPILFVGKLIDVATNQDGTYQVIVERYSRYTNDIRVALSCHESVAMPLIQEVNAKSSPRRREDTAIIGHIERIISTSQKDSEGDTTTVLTGVGRCLNAIYLN